VARRGRVRAGTPSEVAQLDAAASELCVVARAPEAPEGALFAEGAPWRFAVAVAPAVERAPAAGRRRARPLEVLAGDCEGPEEVVAACAERAVVAHDAKSLGLVAPGLSHDTLLGAYLLDPARRGYPVTELCEERG